LLHKIIVQRKDIAVLKKSCAIPNIFQFPTTPQKFSLNKKIYYRFSKLNSIITLVDSGAAGG
jgi:hypothetical protein